MQELEDEGDEEGVEAAANVMTGMKDGLDGEDEEEGLHPQDIDAYWLQRRITRHVSACRRGILHLFSAPIPWRAVFNSSSPFPLHILPQQLQHVPLPYPSALLQPRAAQRYSQ